MWEFLLNLIEFLFSLEFLICCKKKVQQQSLWSKWVTENCMWFFVSSISLFRIFCFSKHDVIHITSVFQINLLSKLSIVSLVLGDWCSSGNIKQVFFMIPPNVVLRKKT